MIDSKWTCSAHRSMGSTAAEAWESDKRLLHSPELWFYSSSWSESVVLHRDEPVPISANNFFTNDITEKRTVTLGWQQGGRTLFCLLGAHPAVLSLETFYSYLGLPTPIYLFWMRNMLAGNPTTWSISLAQGLVFKDEIFGFQRSYECEVETTEYFNWEVLPATIHN